VRQSVDTSRKQTMLRVLLAIAVFSALAIVLWVRGFGHSQVDHIQAAAEEGAAAFEPLAMTPLVDRAQIRGTLEALEFTSGADLVASKRAALLDLIAEFLAAYYLPEDVTQYAAWRERHGSVRRSKETMIHWAADDALQYLTGQAPPAGISVGELHGLLWKAERTGEGGLHRAVAMATTADGLSGVAARSPPDQPLLPPLSSSIAPRLWHGQRGSSGRSWFDPPVTRAEAAQSDGKVLMASVGIVLKFANGNRVPCIIICFWSDARGWIIDGISFDNYLGKFGPAVEW